MALKRQLPHPWLTLPLFTVPPLVLVLALLTGACAPAPEADQQQRRYTLAQIQHALHVGQTLAVGPAFPGGLPPDTILSAGEEMDALKVSAAFSEGAPAAYVITDLWINFDAVWLQPWYVLITAWNDHSPWQSLLRDADGQATPPLFDVGPQSAFYSPFWHIIFAVVPAGTAADKYRSTRQLFEDRLPLYQGAPWVYAIRPAAVGLVPARPVHPILGLEIGGLSAPVQGALIEGQPAPFFNGGGNNFRFDDHDVVEEVPLFVFAGRDPAGAPAPWGAPRVVGSAPLFSRRPAEVINGQPRFGAFVRFHLAYVPPSAAAFDPEQYPGAVARLAALSPAVDAKVFQGRVAANGRKVATSDRDCFAEQDFPASCRWLDSQQRIEEALGPADIERTAITAAAPLVFYDGKAVGAR